MCGQCPGCPATLCNHTHSLISPLLDVCMSVPVHTHTHPHQSQTTQASGEPWEGNFMLPDSPVRPQWRPSNTHAAAITHRDGVYVRKRMCICRSIRPALTNVCGRGSDSCLYILLTTGSSTFNWDNLGNDSSTTSDISHLLPGKPWRVQPRSLFHCFLQYHHYPC